MTTTYKLIHTNSGYAIGRENGDYAEFIDSAEAEAALRDLDAGDTTEADYDWYAVSAD